MYKVFYNNSAIIIGEQLTTDENTVQTVQVLNRKEIFHFLEEFLTTGNPVDFFLDGYDVEEIFAGLKSYFQYLEAAGGLVQNSLQEYLFIRRFGIWDLAKGKIERNESPEETAIREVREETGLKGIRLNGELPATYHIYPLNDRFVLKKTHWFSMITQDKSPLNPQVEEEITEAVWLDKEKSKQAIQTSYRSLKENFLPFFQD